MLADLIYRKLRMEHVGMSHAIKREDLLDYINANELGGVYSDRDMRRAIENHLPMVLTGPHGYWIPDPAEMRKDVTMAISYLSKKKSGLESRIQAIKRAYPEQGQMELF